MNRSRTAVRSVLAALHLTLLLAPCGCDSERRGRDAPAEGDSSSRDGVPSAPEVTPLRPQPRQIRSDRTRRSDRIRAGRIESGQVEPRPVRPERPPSGAGPSFPPSPSPSDREPSRPAPFEDNDKVELTLEELRGIQPEAPRAEKKPDLSPDGKVLINEIQYHPASSSPEDEWLELLNLGTENVGLAGWRLEGGPRFTFPPGVVLPSGGYLVVAASRRRVQLETGPAGGVLVLGDWTGSLDREGGKLSLVDGSGTVVDRVSYSSRPPYPGRAAGGGSSLERRNPSRSGELAANWGAARAASRSIRAPGTTEPASSPGRVNSILTDSLPPLVYPGIAHEPRKPDRRSRVEIRARIGAESLKSATLYFEIDPYRTGAPPRTEPLRALENETAPDAPASFGERDYSARIGPFPEGTLVRYWISARDESGAETRYPAAESETSALGFFIDPGVSSKLPVYHVFIAPADFTALNRQPMSDLYRKATFVHDGEVYCDVGFRFRGQTSRRYAKKQLKIKLNRDQVFTTPIPGHAPLRSINLKSAYVDKIYMREVLGFDLYRELEEPNCETFFVRLQLNGEYMGLYLQVENSDSQYLKRNRLDGGWLWKAYATGHGEGQSLGSRSDLARPTQPGGLHEFELKAGDPARAPQLLNDFLQNINRLRGEELESYIRDHMDVDSFIDFLVGCQLMHNVDHVMKNHLVYADRTGRFTFLAWDLDLTHGRNYECGPGILNDVVRHDMWDGQFGDEQLLYGTMVHPKCDRFWNATINAFLGRAESFREPYYERLAECLGRYYHPDILIPKARRIRERIREEVVLDRRRWASYGSDQDFDRRYKLFENWVRARYLHLKAKLERLGHEVAEPLNAHFVAHDARGAAPRRVRFENLSYGRSLKYEWNFGDGETSTSKSPRHTYTKPGHYDVTLKVKNRSGEHVTVKRDSVYVAP